MEKGERKRFVWLLFFRLFLRVRREHKGSINVQRRKEEEGKKGVCDRSSLSSPTPEGTAACLLACRLSLCLEKKLERRGENRKLFVTNDAADGARFFFHGWSLKKRRGEVSLFSPFNQRLF